MLMMLVSTYKWTFNQIALLTFHDDLFEIEIISITQGMCTQLTRIILKQSSNGRVGDHEY